MIDPSPIARPPHGTRAPRAATAPRATGRTQGHAHTDPHNRSVTDLTARNTNARAHIHTTKHDMRHRAQVATGARRTGCAPRSVTATYASAFTPSTRLSSGLSPHFPAGPKRWKHLRRGFSSAPWTPAPAGVAPAAGLCATRPPSHPSLSSGREALEALEEGVHVRARDPCAGRSGARRGLVRTTGGHWGRRCDGRCRREITLAVLLAAEERHCVSRVVGCVPVPASAGWSRDPPSGQSERVLA